MLALTVNPSDEIVNLAPLTDGTPCAGIIGEGKPIGVDVEWRDHVVGICFEPRGAYVDIDNRLFRVAEWARRRKNYRSPDMIAIVDQVIERARSWQPHLFA